MNKKYFCLLVIVPLIAVGVCIYFSASVKQTPTITQGIYGQVTLSSGNCMPGTYKFKCASTFAVSRTIYIREPATGDILHLENKTQLIKQVTSNKRGFYEVELSPGTYSLFVEDLGKEYCDNLGPRGELCQITIGVGVKEYHIRIGHIVS